MSSGPLDMSWLAIVPSSEEQCRIPPGASGPTRTHSYVTARAHGFLKTL